MAEAIMSHPDLRHPFEKRPIDSGKTIVLYAGKEFQLDGTPDGAGLWVTAEDLTRINGFVIKPEGACYEGLCIPLRDDESLVRQEDGKQFLNLAAFADLLEQPYTNDPDTNVWSFGEIPAKRQNMLADGMAPDFEVEDRQGNVVRMSDFKGRKALIITWSSW